jgi:hypothetical protein
LQRAHDVSLDARLRRFGGVRATHDALTAQVVQRARTRVAQALARAQRAPLRTPSSSAGAARAAACAVHARTGTSQRASRSAQRFASMHVANRVEAICPERYAHHHPGMHECARDARNARERGEVLHEFP